MGRHRKPEVVGRIMCLPVAHIKASEAEGVEPIPWTQATCCVCSCDVALSISMKPRVDAGEYEPICNGCTAKQGVPPGQVFLHPDQLEELSGVPGLFGFSQQFVERVNKYGIFARQPGRGDDA